MKLPLIGIIFVSIASFSSYCQAKQNSIYVVGTAGYATNDVNDYGHDEVSYKVNLGYVISKQWSVEFGYSGLGDSGLSNNELAIDNDNFETNDYSINAFTLSALGRATNQHGELFYRVGVMQVNAERAYALGGDVCQGSDSAIETFPSAIVCQSDDDQIAGVLGLGFDFNMTSHIQLRVEAEHIQGQDDYSAQAFLIGLRVNF